MKKFFLFIVIAFTTIGVNAQQTTYIAKFGFSPNIDGVLTIRYVNAGFEVNIPISATNWTFSPSLHGTLLVEDDVDGQSAVYMPLAIGYKASLGNRWIFRPTFGPMVGYAFENEDGSKDSSKETSFGSGFIAGPVLGLNFENTHFSVGLQVLYSLTELEKIINHISYYNSSLEYANSNYIGAYLTLGYKF